MTQQRFDASATGSSTPRDPSPVSIDRIVDIKSRRPSATTRERGWDGVTVDLYAPLSNCAGHYPPLDHHLVCYCPAGRARLVQKRAGQVHDGWFSAGASLLMPAGCDSTWDGDSATSARLRIPAALVVSAAEQIGHQCTSRFELRNVFETRDVVIERMAQILLAELEHKPHPAQALIVEQTSLCLAAHLLRAYNAFEPLPWHEVPSLGRCELGRLTEYIEENIDRQIGLGELAALVNVSRFHFSRLFKRSTGMTVIGYVEQCRIRRAQALILETDFPLTEVALMTGFSDQSHFTRRFHRHIGCTPAVFAREHGQRRAARHAAF